MAALENLHRFCETSVRPPAAFLAVRKKTRFSGCDTASGRITMKDVGR